MAKEQEMAPKKTKSHWAYLEEIEAPMWVDLTLEANSVHQEPTDDWFRRSHPFHQCSSVQLKDMFSHSGVGNADFESQGLSSPKLPSSVSKSRGKHYKSRNWVTGNTCVLALDKKNTEKTLNGKNSSCADTGPCEERKSKSSCRNTKGTCDVQAGLVCQSSTGENVVPSNYIPVSSFGDIKASSSSTAITSDRNSTKTSGLLSILRMNIRNSYITRQASRVELNDGGQSKAHMHSSSKSSVGSSSSLLHDVNTKTKEFQKKDQSVDNRNVTRKVSRGSINDSGQSEVRKYSSGKSSVGSSTSLLYDANSTTRKGQKKDQGLDCRKFTGMSGAAKNRVNVTNLSKARIVEGRTFQSKARTAKLPYKDVAKKVLHPTVHKKAHRVNERDLLTTTTKNKPKVGVSSFRRMPRAGKENAIGRTTENQKAGYQDPSVDCKVRHQNLTRRGVIQKAGKTGPIGPMEKIISECKFPRNATQKVYLR